MKTEIKYQVQTASHNIDIPIASLSEAVLTAASYDGFGAVYKRDEDGYMRLYSSKRHLGNNPYFPDENDAFKAESRLMNDSEAIKEVAKKIYKRGVFHSQYEDINIIELTYVDGVLQLKGVENEK